MTDEEYSAQEILYFNERYGVQQQEAILNFYEMLREKAGQGDPDFTWRFCACSTAYEYEKPLDEYTEEEHKDIFFKRRKRLIDLMSLSART